MVEKAIEIDPENITPLYFSDNIWRSMTHEAIKNFDWSYKREYTDGDDYRRIDWNVTARQKKPYIKVFRLYLLSEENLIYVPRLYRLPL